MLKEKLRHKISAFRFLVLLAKISHSIFISFHFKLNITTTSSETFIDRLGSAGPSTPPIVAAAPATFPPPFFHSSSGFSAIAFSFPLSLYFNLNFHYFRLNLRNIIEI
ncbi:unnamed protein product [Trifolium pratense]|uniref:Uncharacterized protein n=1 Tax=Trifolium pratense TaxID=57577 RepID=A0ACB0L3D1_TRIPR|nr:unnamed protein product [Trifolium pratense]